MPIPEDRETARLLLPPMDAAFLRASLEGSLKEAEEIVGARLPEDWPHIPEVLRRRLDQVEQAPEDAPWYSRLVVLKEEARVIGIAGFHGPPGGDWLGPHIPGGVELGYQIEAPYRRRGFALEACEGLLHWALLEQRVPGVLLSMSPANVASARIAVRLGFERSGTWVHEIRGLEHLWMRLTPSRE